MPTTTGNATHVGFSVNGGNYWEGVKDVPDTTLNGTANSYALTNSDKLFVYCFSRDCTDFRPETGGNRFSISDSMVPVDHPIKLFERAYLPPGTVRGPDSTKVLSPIVIEVWSKPAKQ